MIPEGARIRVPAYGTPLESMWGWPAQETVCMGVDFGCLNGPGVMCWVHMWDGSPNPQIFPVEDVEVLT